MIHKLVKDAATAVADIADGSTLMLGALAFVAFQKIVSKQF